MLSVHTCIPGKVESYDPLTKKASVKPLIKMKVNNESLSYPVINNVPVVFPGSKDVVIAFPLSAGDGCLILFSEQAMENYLSSTGKEVEPGDNRRYSVNDAICIPGLFPFTSPGKTGGTIGLEIIFKGYKIIINDTGITLSSTDASPWQPNILFTDPFTGLPHGGPTAGILKLRGA
jgi:hypothetical protein